MTSLRQVDIRNCCIFRSSKRYSVLKLNADEIRPTALHQAILCPDGDFSEATWVAFHGCYDFAIPVQSPVSTDDETKEEFMALPKWYFGGRIYDVKCLIRRCDGLYGGLEMVAEKLDVKRAEGKAHQGSDSLLTCKVFLRMKKIYFGPADDGKERKLPFERLIFGLNS